MFQGEFTLAVVEINFVKSTDTRKKYTFEVQFMMNTYYIFILTKSKIILNNDLTNTFPE